MDWIDLAKDRDRWRDLASAVMTFVVNTMLGISWLTEEIFTSQEGLCSMELVSWLVRFLFVCLSVSLCVCFFLCYSHNFQFLYLRISTIWIGNIIIIKSIFPSRSIGCLWVFSTSVYQPPRTLVHSSFYPLPWLLIFSSYFSVFLSSSFLEDSSVGRPLVFLHPLFLMCDLST